MAEFIGSRISLISKRDIRYVGTLHKIDSENSTVALEQVVSFGTEGRRPEDEVAPTDIVYDYIVFRGSDVKDLRIEGTPKENQPPKPRVPDDPAILGSGRGLTSPLAEHAPAPEGQQTQTQQGQQFHQAQQPPQTQLPLQSQLHQPQQPNNPQQSYQFQQRQEPASRFPQQPFPFYYPPPPNQRFGPQGFPPHSGFPVMQYGAPPPTWFPPGQGFHYPPPAAGHFYPPQPPIGSNVQQNAQGRSQVPPGSHAPGASQAPPINQVPAGPQATAPSQAPTPSQASAVSKAPAVSKDPVVSQAPAVPQTPAASQAPVVSQAPAASQAPAVSQAPASSQAPAVSQAAAVSQSSAALQTSAIARAPAAQNSLAPQVNTVEGQGPPSQKKHIIQPQDQAQHKHQWEQPEKVTATVRLPSNSATPAPPQIPPSLVAQSGPPLPTTSKPDVVAALAPPVAPAEPDARTETVPTGPKNGRIMPAIPRLSPAFKAHVPANGTLQPKSANVVNQDTKPVAKPAPSRPAQPPTKSVEDASRDARAAVAAAMAKLPPAPGPKSQEETESTSANLAADKVHQPKRTEHSRTPRQPGSGQPTGYRGRGGYRGGRSYPEQNSRKVEVPATDYDFASANAKFNKQDLVKAVTAGTPLGSPVDGAIANDNTFQTSANGSRHGSQPSIIVPSAVSYDKSSSFFDNISSESRDRDEAHGKKLGGREFRSEEVKKNFETFGQGSVDNGYRGGYRGRVRGRGYGRGRGGYGRGGRGQIRGGAGLAAVIAEG